MQYSCYNVKVVYVFIWGTDIYFCVSKSNLKLGGFWFQLQAYYMSSHSETVCLWMTIYMYIYMYIYIYILKYICIILFIYMMIHKLVFLLFVYHSLLKEDLWLLCLAFHRYTALSKHYWGLKNKGLTPDIQWSILKRSSSPKSFDSRCNLCLEEKIHILLLPEPKILLNKRNELIARCRHRAKFKL